MTDRNDSSGRDEVLRLLRAQQVAKLGSWEVDLARNTLTWNDGVFSIFEIEREDFGGTEEAFFALIHPDDLPHFLKAREDWLAQGGSFLFEHRIVTPGGEIKFVVERAEILANEAGEPEYTTGTVQDVTDLKQAEKELERQSRLRKFAGRLAHLGSWRVDLSDGSITWDDEAAAIHDEPPGTSPDQDKLFEYCVPEHRDRVRAGFKAAIDEGRSLDDTFQVRTAKGRLVWVQAIGEPVRDEHGQVVAIEGAIQDVTAAKSTEEELLRQARRRRLAGRLARMGSWSVDLVTPRITWCEETAAIHDEPEGTSPTLDRAIDYYVPEHRDRIRARFEACATEGVPFDETLQIETAKGRRVWVRALGEPLRGAEGKIVAVEGAFQDITNRIEVRDETARLSVRLRRTLEGMNDAFFLLDDSWRFAFVNAKAESLLKRTRGDLLGKSVWQMFPEAVGSAFQENYERALAEERSVRFQAYFPPLEKWFEVSADPTQAGLAVYFHDVTWRREQEAQLRLLKAAVDQQSDVLIITDATPEGPRIVYVNDAFERVTGYTREEAIGQSPRLQQGPGTSLETRAKIRSALERGEAIRTEILNYRKDGTAFWKDLNIHPLRNQDGQITHWIAVERDISERKQIEDALRANEERFRLVAKAAGNAIWDLDINGNREWWSEGLRDIFGHDPDAETMEPGIWTANIHPDDLPRADAAFERLISGQDSVLRDQYRFRRADGSWALVEDNAFALHDDQGNVLRVLGSMTDISERKLLEERLHQAQKMETVGQLTGGVAHDFNNLLTVILGNAELMDEALEDQPRLQTMASMIAKAALRGSELTNSLLAFARRQPLQPRVLDVAQHIHGMDGLLRRTLPENIDIEIIRAGGLWQIEADAAQLEAALLNLALNARDAMPDGGHLTIEVANAVLDDDYAATEPDVRPGQYVVIIVSDTGHGIPADVLPRVFEPFFSTKETGKGSGMGLSMVFGFVKQSGGHIRVYSEMDEGTSIKMYFPRSRTKSEKAVTDRAGRRIVGGAETVLAVEDDDAVRQYVVAQLAGLGYRVIEASNGRDALDILSRNRVDLLFTDVVMPGGIGGRELADAAQELRPDLKVLFTSGYTENSIVHQGRLDRGVKLLSKPYRREQLAAKIRDVLDEVEPPANQARFKGC